MTSLPDLFPRKLGLKGQDPGCKELGRFALVVPSWKRFGVRLSHLFCFVLFPGETNRTQRPELHKPSGLSAPESILHCPGLRNSTGVWTAPSVAAPLTQSVFSELPACPPGLRDEARRLPSSPCPRGSADIDQVALARCLLSQDGLVESMETLERY